jgi:hypothetical protein
MLPEEMFMIVFVFGMFAGVFIIFLGLRQRSQQLEMHHRERMAMIERGQIPLTDPEVLHVRRAINVGPSSRSLSVGIIVVGLGLALATIISIAGESPEVGIGVGGAIAILGGAFIVRSIIVRPDVTSSGSGSVKPSSFPDERL